LWETPIISPYSFGENDLKITTSVPGSERHVRNPSILSDDRLSCATFQSQGSLNGFLKSPRRGATVHDDARCRFAAT
jgi:hypothetical protein